MGLNPFDSGSDENDEEVYIGEVEEESDTDYGGSSDRSVRERNGSNEDTLETELEEKLIGEDPETENVESDREDESVSLEDVHRQNKEIIDLLEKINNKM